MAILNVISRDIEAFQYSYRNWLIYFLSIEKEDHLFGTPEEMNLNLLYEIDSQLKLINESILALSDTALRDGVNYCNEAKRLAEEFVLRRDSPTAFTLLTKLHTRISTFLESQKSFIIRSNYTTNLEKLKSEAETNAEIVASKVLEADKQLDQLMNKASPLLKSLEIANYNDDFAQVAVKNLKSANGWMWGVIGLIIVFLFFVSCFITSGFEFRNIDNHIFKSVEDLKPKTNLGLSLYYLEIGKAIFYRLLVITTITFLIRICYRNYQACMHNFTLNTHKANSMKAALGIINKAVNVEVQDTILQLAANAIFSHQPSGYNDKDVENFSNSENVIGKIIDKIPTNK